MRGVESLWSGRPPAANQGAAEIYAKAHGIEIDVVGGPAPKWIEQARQDVDLTFSGSETMMTNFVKAMESRIGSAEAAPLYLRPSVILVKQRAKLTSKPGKTASKTGSDAVLVQLWNHFGHGAPTSLA